MCLDYLVLCFISRGFIYNLDFWTEGCLNQGSPSVSWQAKAIHKMTRWPRWFFSLAPRGSTVQRLPVCLWDWGSACGLTLNDQCHLPVLPMQCRLKHLHRTGPGGALCSQLILGKVGGSRACSVVTEPAHNLYSGSWTLSLAETWEWLWACCCCCPLSVRDYIFVLFLLWGNLPY